LVCRNCSWVNSILEDAKEINALQLAIDEIESQDGIVVTVEDVGPPQNTHF
jgi:hypothetical protein